MIWHCINILNFTTKAIAFNAVVVGNYVYVILACTKLFILVTQRYLTAPNVTERCSEIIKY